MAEDEPYDILPHRELTELKKQLKELRIKTEKSSSQEMLSSISSMTRSMDAMLRLFSEAAEELKIEGKRDVGIAEKLDPLGKKLDEVIEQNMTIAHGIVTISDMINNLVEKEKPKPVPEPKHGFSEPLFSSTLTPEQPVDQQIQKPGPVAMPAMPFSNLGEEPKKGLFGRLKK